jgi:hypothetical protein
MDNNNVFRVQKAWADVIACACDFTERLAAGENRDGTEIRWHSMSVFG